MIRVRQANARGHADYGWLNTYHTFSFNTYYDPAHNGFRSLLVINEDRVKPGRGFPLHGHENMEIISYVLEGALEHKDSMGHGSVLTPGEFQRMSAGTGIRHSEFNPSSTEPVHFYQIWLMPDREGHKPSYEQRRIEEVGMLGKLRLVASPDGADDSLTIHQDARVYLTKLKAGDAVPHVLPSNRHAWLQVLRGRMTVNGVALGTSDGAAISDESELNIRSDGSSESMLFDLP